MVETPPTPDERYDPDSLGQERFGEVPLIEITDEPAEVNATSPDPTEGLSRLSSSQVNHLEQLEEAVADEQMAVDNLELARREGKPALIELAERRLAVTQANHRRLLSEFPSIKSGDQP